MHLWWILTVPPFLFVAIDIWRTPAASFRTWPSIILTAFPGPIRASL